VCQIAGLVEAWDNTSARGIEELFGLMVNYLHSPDHYREEPRSLRQFRPGRAVAGYGCGAGRTSRRCRSRTKGVAVARWLTPGLAGPKLRGCARAKPLRPGLLNSSHIRIVYRRPLGVLALTNDDVKQTVTPDIK